jgi:hypothetical protein
VTEHWAFFVVRQRKLAGHDVIYEEVRRSGNGQYRPGVATWGVQFAKILLRKAV